MNGTYAFALLANFYVWFGLIILVMFLSSWVILLNIYVYLLSQVNKLQSIIVTGLRFSFRNGMSSCVCYCISGIFVLNIATGQLCFDLLLPVGFDFIELRLFLTICLLKIQSTVRPFLFVIIFQSDLTTFSVLYLSMKLVFFYFSHKQSLTNFCHVGKYSMLKRFFSE